MDLAGQANTFFFAILDGICLGVLFDVYRVIRHGFRLRAAATACGDLLFWLVATAITFLMLLKANWGEFRFYVLIGIALGAAGYFRFSSRHMLFLLVRLAQVMATCWRNVKRLIAIFMAPLWWLLRAVAIMVKWPVRRFRRRPPPLG